MRLRSSESSDVVQDVFTANENNIECETCHRSLSTFGLIGDVITCDSCGTMNGINAKSEPIVPSASITKLRIDPYGIWQKLVMP
jgi:ribosomal protein S27E